MAHSGNRVIKAPKKITKLTGELKQLKTVRPLPSILGNNPSPDKSLLVSGVAKNAVPKRKPFSNSFPPLSGIPKRQASSKRKPFSNSLPPLSGIPKATTASRSPKNTMHAEQNPEVATDATTQAVSYGSSSGKMRKVNGDALGKLKKQIESATIFIDQCQKEIGGTKQQTSSLPPIHSSSSASTSSNSSTTPSDAQKQSFKIPTIQELGEIYKKNKDISYRNEEYRTEGPWEKYQKSIGRATSYSEERVQKRFETKLATCNNSVIADIIAGNQRIFSTEDNKELHNLQEKNNEAALGNYQDPLAGSHYSVLGRIQGESKESTDSYDQESENSVAYSQEIFVNTSNQPEEERPNMSDSPKQRRTNTHECSTEERISHLMETTDTHERAIEGENLLIRDDLNATKSQIKTINEKVTELKGRFNIPDSKSGSTESLLQQTNVDKQVEEQANIELQTEESKQNEGSTQGHSM